MMRTCSLCFSTVAPQYAEAHYRWHLRNGVQTSHRNGESLMIPLHNPSEARARRLDYPNHDCAAGNHTTEMGSSTCVRCGDELE